MMIPVTSTKVATNGAEEVAGSSPNFLIIIGSIEPRIAPQATTPSREIETAVPNKNQCSPYTYEAASQIVIRKKPNKPRIAPRIKPIEISLLKISHQFLIVISPRERARITKVAA